jgi:hypothetical protein
MRRRVSYEISAGANEPIKVWEENEFVKLEQGGEQIHFDYPTAAKLHTALGEMIEAQSQ